MTDDETETTAKALCPSRWDITAKHVRDHWMDAAARLHKVFKVVANDVVPLVATVVDNVSVSASVGPAKVEAKAELRDPTAKLADENDPGSPVEIKTSDGGTVLMSQRAFAAFQKESATSILATEHNKPKKKGKVKP